MYSKDILCHKLQVHSGASRPPLLHRQLMSVFVGAGLISAPGTPCKNL